MPSLQWSCPDYLPKIQQVIQVGHDNDMLHLAEHVHDSYRLQNQKYRALMLRYSNFLDLVLIYKHPDHYICLQLQDQISHYLKRKQLQKLDHLLLIRFQKLLLDKV